MINIRRFRINQVVNLTLTQLHHPKCKSRASGKRFFKLSVFLKNDGINAPTLQAQPSEKVSSAKPITGKLNQISSSKPSSSTHSHTGTISDQQSAGVRLLQPDLQPNILNNPKVLSPAALTQDARREILSPNLTVDNPKDKMQISSHNLRTTFDSPTTSPSEENSLLASRRVDPTTVRQVYYFDTLAFTKKLESRGFTREQAEGCAECLVEIINTTLDHQGRHMVTKPQQEIAVQQLMSEIVSVKKDMTLLQKSEFSSLKTETEKMSIELSQVQGHMNDEIVKLKGQFSLDINLERGRAIEAHAENEKKLQQLHNKIETEIANLKTIYEVYRNDVFKYAGGTVIAVATLMLGVIRLWF
ncbi:unnamed protein product [Lymnaea stagnalis]|uniref:Mitochondrial calcium uniporter regulator 1 n=1 Tax=Lymnaea stagnalis TaxID=6523 RepID=A0AAV2HH76_LYMST